MKIFITELLLIFFISFGVVLPQGNPDFNPYGKRININPPRYFTGALSSYWTTVAPSPYALSRSATAYVVLNGVGYVYQFGGGADASLTSVARYNLNTNAWETIGFQPIPAPMSAATAITIGTKIYLFGGEKYSGLGLTFAFDATTGTWDSNFPVMPDPRTDAAVVKYSDQYVLIVGGGDGYFPGPVTTYSFSKQVQLFDVNNRTYSILPNSNYPVPFAMSGFGIFNDTIFCVGGIVSDGSTSAGVIDSVYKGIITKDANLKPTKVTWSKMPKYPGGPVTRPASVSVLKGNGAGLMVTGGAINGVSMSTLSYVWDYINYLWVPLPDLPLGRANMKAAFYPDSSAAFVVAGFTTIGTGQTDKLTFIRFDGVAYQLNPFNLVTPPSGSTLTSVAGSLVPLAFNWDTSGTGAFYKFRFKNAQGNNVIDTTINQNLFKITAGDLDRLLARKGVVQGDSIAGSWNVTAVRGPGAPGSLDSIISTNGPWQVSLKRYKPILSAFNLFLPVSNTKIVTSVLNNFPQNFVWNKSGLGANYKLMFAYPTFDSLKFIKFTLAANSSGIDSTFTILNSALDSLLARIGMNRGDSLAGQWRVYAYSGADSLASNTFNLTLARSPFNLNHFTLLAPPNLDTVSLANYTVLNFNWSVSSVGATYKWSFNSVVLPSNNNGFDTNLTVSTTDLDGLIGAGTIVSGKWKIWAYKGIDSLVSDTAFSITFTRTTQLPLYQPFDVTQFPPVGWTVSATGPSKWTRETPNNNGAAKFDFFNSPAGTIQALITNVFPASKQVAKAGSDSLYFDYAHAYVSLNNIDSLFVYYSTDAGVTYTQIKDANYGSNPVPFASLSTTTYTAGPYSPAVNEWGTKILVLPTGTNRLKFLVKSGWGNNLFLDNIKLKNMPPSLITPGNYIIDINTTPQFKWDLTAVFPGYPNFYRFQLWTDSTFTDPLQLIKDTTFQDVNIYNYPTNLPVDVGYTWRVNISNQGGTSRFSIIPFHYFIDTIYALNNSFANPQFPQKGWRVNSFGNPTFWSRDSTVGFGDNFSAKYNFYQSPPTTTEELVTNTYAISSSDTLYFNYAHAFAGNFNVDSLFLFTSTDNGKTWKEMDSTGRFGSSPTPFASLSTATLVGSPFVPNASQWGLKTVVMPNATNKVKFVVFSGQGNNLFLDNIRINTTKLIVQPLTPTAFKLNYNYPNPFNPTTTISFAIPKVAHTKLVIYDVLGREIVKLVNQVLEPNTYKIQFNGSNLSSGVYFYRLEAGDFVDVKKMLLIK